VPILNLMVHAIDRAARADRLKRVDPASVGASLTPRARYALYTAVWAAVFVTSQALTVPTRIAIDRPLPRLLLHAPVQCVIALAIHHDALLVPRSALLPASGDRGTAVMIAIGDRAQERTVRTGIRNGDLVEVTEGLKEGDTLISGPFRELRSLKPGDLVREQKPEESSGPPRG